MRNSRITGRALVSRFGILLKWVVMLIVLTSSNCNDKPPDKLDVVLYGCIVYLDKTPYPICATGANAAKHKLYLLISGTPEYRISVFINKSKKWSGALGASGKSTVALSAADLDGRLRIDLDEPHQEGVFAADIVAKNPFGGALAVRQQIKSHPKQDWPRQVEQVLLNFDETTRTFSAPEKAYLLGQLGSILEIWARDVPAEQLSPALRELAARVLHRAIDASHAVGLLSVEAVSLQRLSTISTIWDQPHGPVAEEVIRELTDPRHQRAISFDLDVNIFVNYKISRIEEDFGRIGKSLASIRKVLPFLQFEGIKDAEKALYLSQYSLIAQYANDTESAMQGSKQTLEILSGSQELNACNLLQHYDSLGWTHLLAQQAGNKGATPVALLKQADSYRAKCAAIDAKTATQEAGFVLLNLARASLLQATQAGVDGEALAQVMAQVERQIEEARALQTTKSDRYLDVHDLSGQLALLRGQGEVALASYRRLRQLTETVEPNPQYRFAALIGEADALAMLNRKAEALTVYGEAERLLELLANGLPMLGRGQLFLAQFAEGLSHHLALLASDPAKKGQLLPAIRRARVLALRAYQQSPQARHAEGDDQKLLAHYLELHDLRDKAAAALLEAPTVEQVMAAERLRKLDEELRESIDQLYQRYRGTTRAATLEEAAALRPPQEGELLLACYPLPSRPKTGEWLCAAADSQDHYVVHTRRLLGPGAAELLSALQSPLSRAKRLHILAYGEMRDVAWEQVPFRGQPLGARAAVSYGLDVITAAAPDVGKRALVVLNPQQDLVGAQRAEGGLIARLRSSGWALELFRGAPRRGGHLRHLWDGSLFDTVRPAVAPPVLEQLPTANLFVYYGHAESSQQGGWDSHLRFADHGSITARDILALPTAPGRVLLLGCHTAGSDPDAPVDELGLAQAFLLRGSREVLATTRKIPDVQAALLLGELLRQGALDGAAGTLAESLRVALGTLRDREPRANWDAFRVYQP